MYPVSETRNGLLLFLTAAEPTVTAFYAANYYVESFYAFVILINVQLAINRLVRAKSCLKLNIGIMFSVTV